MSKLNLKSFIVNNKELIIDKGDWQKINVNYTKLYDELNPPNPLDAKPSEDRVKELKELIREEKTRIKEAISEAIEGLPLPLLPITEEEAKEDFKNLEEFETRSLLRKNDIHTKAEYKYEASNWYISNSNIGRPASNYFHQEARFAAKHWRFDSPLDSWTIKRIHQEFLEPLWTMKMGQVNTLMLRQCIVLRKYLASQFPPAVAKELYNLFDAKHVFDFSMGWGDRLAGFHASNAESYYGTDPNIAVFKNYENQNKLYGTNKKTIFKNSPAEDLDLNNEKFDMVFTSPPYFDVEQYSKDESQSWQRYGSDIDAWLNNFLFVVIDKCWNSLVDGGTLIINISDIFKNKEFVKICDPMNDYISKLPKAHYTGCTGLRLSKRPNSKNDRPEDAHKTSVEPIWIWKKNDKRTLNQIIDESSPLNKFFK